VDEKILRVVLEDIINTLQTTYEDMLSSLLFLLQGWMIFQYMLLLLVFILGWNIFLYRFEKKVSNSHSSIDPERQVIPRKASKKNSFEQSVFLKDC